MADDRDKLEMLLCEYLDGELKGEQAAELERRLEQDPALRDELRRYAAMEGRLAALGDEELPDVDYEAQRAAIMAAVERKALLGRSTGRRWAILRPVFAGLAAAAAVLIAVGVWTVLSRPEGPQTPRIAANPQGSVTVSVLPVARGPSGGEGTVRVEYPRLDVMELHLAMPSDTVSPSEPPAGTVVVSVGTEDRDTPRSPDGLGMFPILIE